MNAETAIASFPALGGTAVVAVADAAGLEAALAEVTAVVEAIDLACSVFRDDSELVALNRAAPSTVTVSALLLDAVDEALRAARITDGDVDPTVGRALIAYGFERDPDDPSPLATRVTITGVPGWRTVVLDREQSTIRLGAGVSLDLGATAKALAADRAAAAAHGAVGCGVLVSLSGDIATAGPAPADGWSVHVTDDHRSEPDAPGQTITLRDGGLATSSTTVRQRRDRDGIAHHLIDPSTGAPAPVVFRTVSVAAGSCLDANIASTAAIIRGERALPWLEGLGLPSRLVRASGAVAHIAGWPPEGDDLSPETAAEVLSR